VAFSSKTRVKVARDRLILVAATAAGKEVSRTTRKVFNRARVLSPWDTGLLRASHSVDLRVLKTNKVVGRVIVSTKYAAAVHEGAKPHIIRPRKKKALKFVYRGQTVIVKSVRHPGNKARPWLLTALREVGALNGYKVSASHNPLT
jgi:hypothetical protein